MKTTSTLATLRRPLALLLAVLALAPLSVWAQPTPNPPGGVSFQGFLTDANGLPLATNVPKNYDVNFRIYTTPNGAGAVWGEVQTVVVDRGYVSVMLGQGASLASGEPWTNNLSGLFIGANASDRYVGITVKGISTPDSEIQPRLRLLASPYSFLAANANAVINNAGQQLISGASGNPVFNMTNATFYGAPTFNGGFAVANGANVTGNPNLTGNPNFSGSPTFSGNPNFSGAMTFSGLVNFQTNAYLNSFDLFLDGSGYGGVGYYPNHLGLNFGGGSFAPYGPVLYGYDGGGLGTVSPTDVALSWDWHGNVVIDPGNLNSGAFNNGSSTGAGLVFGSGSGEGIFSKRTAAGGNQYSLNLCTAYTTRIAILQNGYVGISTPTPAYTLDVGSGNIHSWSMYTDGYFFTKWGSSYYALYETGGSPNYAYWSDQRLKQDLQTIPNAVKTVQQLRGINFHWNETGLNHLTRDIEEKWRSASGTPEDNQKLWAEKRAERTAELVKTQTGFVAQEIEQVFPDWVTTDPKTGYKQVNTQHLDAVLVNAIKEQQDQLDAQQQRIAALQAANAALEQRLQALEKGIKGPAAQTGSGR